MQSKMAFWLTFEKAIKSWWWILQWKVLPYKQYPCQAYQIYISFPNLISSPNERFLTAISQHANRVLSFFSSFPWFPMWFSIYYLFLQVFPSLKFSTPAARAGPKFWYQLVASAMRTSPMRSSTTDCHSLTSWTLSWVNPAFPARSHQLLTFPCLYNQ